MAKQILRYADLEIVLGLNRVTIWRRINSDPNFPRPIRLGGVNSTAVGFIASEVDQWIQRQARSRNLAISIGEK